MKKKYGKLYRWLDERLALSALYDFFLNEPMPGGASVWYVFGSGLVFLLIMQVLTGVLLLFYYAPTMDHAWESIRYLMEEVPYGGFVRGLHHWGASLLVIVAVLHVTQVFVWGAYKSPRELTWVAGIFSLATIMGFAWTGYLLPWDQLSYWGTMVGTEIIGTMPVVGEAFAKFIRGGGSIGAQTLSRFFAFHIMIMPIGLAFFVLFHLYLFRKQGVAGPFKGSAKALEQNKTFFFPRQFFIDALFALCIYLVMVYMAIFFTPELRSPANPAISPAHVAPEWYFLFLYELLKHIPREFIVVGTTIIPGIFGLLLIGLPFYDRSRERHPLKRWRALIIYFLILSGLVALTLMAFASAPETLRVDEGLAAKGRLIYKEKGCAFCHRIHDEGADIGPDLSYEGLSGRSPDWMRGHLRDPKGYVPGSTMPKAKDIGLTGEDIEALTHYLFSLQ